LSKLLLDKLQAFEVSPRRFVAPASPAVSGSLP
jgi:hypothetical protein